MKQQSEVAREMRQGAERLRKIAALETDAACAAELSEIAQEMDMHAAELERGTVDEPLQIADDAAA